MQIVNIYKCTQCKYGWSAVHIPQMSPQNCPKCMGSYFDWTNYDDLVAAGAFDLTPEEIASAPKCETKTG